MAVPGSAKEADKFVEYRYVLHCFVRLELFSFIICKAWESKLCCFLSVCVPVRWLLRPSNIPPDETSCRNVQPRPRLLLLAVAWTWILMALPVMDVHAKHVARRFFSAFVMPMLTNDETWEEIIHRHRRMHWMNKLSRQTTDSRPRDTNYRLKPNRRLKPSRFCLAIPTMQMFLLAKANPKLKMNLVPRGRGSLATLSDTWFFDWLVAKDLVLLRKLHSRRLEKVRKERSSCRFVFKLWS